MSQFCRNRLKIEQNYITLSLMLVQNHIQNLIKILVLVSSSISTPNTGSLTRMILHLWLKVVNVLAKTWFIKTNLQ